MLIRLEIENFRSILHPVELSMVAVDKERTGVRAFANLGESLLPIAAIYGPNASGKSNLAAALDWISSGVRDSLRFWDEGIPVDRFAFKDAGATAFSLEYVVDGVRFEYSVELNEQEVLYEALFHYPERRRRRLFERDGLDLTLQRGLGSITGTRELLTPTSLVLSIARRFEEPLIRNFALQLSRAQSLGMRSRVQRAFRASRMSSNRIFQPSNESRLTRVNELTRRRAIGLLRMADLGIEDVVYDEDRRLPQLLHSSGTDEAVAFDFNDESEGTRTWYSLIGPLLSALDEGSLLVFDELDASLHPTLSAEILRLFSDPATNPRGSQLIFTSHDTSLLDHLNRDEVWLTEKDRTGATSLSALAKFAGDRVEGSRDLESGYLAGRFGAIPDLDRLGLWRALGLIG